MNRRTAILSTLAAAFGGFWRLFFKSPPDSEPLTGRYNRFGASFLYNGKVYRTRSVNIERTSVGGVARLQVTFELDPDGEALTPSPFQSPQTTDS